MALVRFAVEVDEDDIYQATVWIWFYIVMALIDDMRIQGIGDDGVFLVRFYLNVGIFLCRFYHAFLDDDMGRRTIFIPALYNNMQNV